ncbi:MAG: ATP-binding protein, partial [Phocaeicola sp.]|nr:ATP-binding protein [Phocaeicola sp.]
VSLREVVETIKNDFSLQLKQQNMVFQSILPECIEVWGNQNLLYALLRNLLENAIRYAGEGTTVVFKYLHKDETHLHFSFYDTGKGIENEAHLPRLFERFYRVNQGRSRDKGGSGLGLSIVKNAVHLHQSEISVRNRKEGGLEFLFSLPIKKSI